MVGIGHLVRVVKRSIESAFMPAPLFLAAWRIVFADVAGEGEWLRWCGWGAAGVI